MRQRLPPLLRRDRERAQLARLDLGHRWRQRRKPHRGVTGDHRSNRWTSPVIGNVHEIEPQRQTELFAREMGLCPRPPEAKLYFPGLAFMSATKSSMFFAGTEGLTKNTAGEATASVIGSKSL